MLFANVCAGFELVENGSFWAFWLLLGALCIWGVLALLVISPVCTRLGFQRCASCWTRPSGGGRWGITFLNSEEFAGKHKKTAGQVYDGFCGFSLFKAVYASFSGTAKSP